MDNIMTLDVVMIFGVQNHLVTEIISPFMIALSTVGNYGLIWILLGIALACKKDYRKTGIAILLGLTFSLIVGNGLLKHLVERTRPCIDYPLVPLLLHAPAANDFSFPSGHAFSSFVAATALFRGIEKKWGRTALGLAAAIAFSRVYLFMHYPSDVFTGALLGIAFGSLAWRLSGPVLVFLEKAKPEQRIMNERECG
ncbi:MAG: phosphatase PAP2 family protein [Anaerovibrio sp.]|nr:phosphatase PAP2 family protein [Anaerovibrio sp.]